MAEARLMETAPMATRLRRVALLLAGSLALVAGAAPAAAQTRPETASPLQRVVSGTFDLTDMKTKKVCRINLAPNPAPKGGFVVGAPPTCRRTLPVITPVVAWTFGADQTITLQDLAGAPVATFKPDVTKRIFRATTDTLSLDLKPVGRAPDGDRGDAIAKALTEATLTDLPPLDPARLAGLYSFSREKNKPICSMDITTVPAGRRGHYVAKLSGGCIDGGMKIFDPIAWYTDRGRFYLVARKGHETRLAPDKDGIFQKDPPTGAQLFLKKQ